MPAVLLPLPAASPIPAACEGYGFMLRVRLVGEHGQVTTAFVRDEGAGFTLIGERELNRIEVERLHEIEERGIASPPSRCASSMLKV